MVKKPVRTPIQFLAEYEEMRGRLAEAEGALRAIRSGEVDAIIVPTDQGEQLFTLNSADYSYRVLVEQMGEGALMLSLDGIILYCNRRFAVMVASPIEQVIGENIRAFVSLSDRVALEAALESRTCARQEIECVLTAGASTPARLTLVFLPLEAPPVIGLTAADLTDAKHREMELVQVRENLEKRVTERTAELQLEIAERKKAEEEIRKLNEELEERVRDRTAQLQSVNIQLESEITERKRAEEALSRRVSDLSALNAIASIVNQALEVDEILNRAIEEALRQVGIEVATMLLLDNETGELVMAAHRGFSEEFIRIFSRMKLGEDLAGKVVKTGQPVTMNDLSEYPGVLSTYVEKEGIKSAASVPLIGHIGVIGVMLLGAVSPHFFDTVDLEFLVTLGQQIGIGIEKVRQYGEISRHNRELSVINAVSSASTESLDLEKTLNNAVDAMLNNLEIEIGSVYLMEPDGETLTLRVVRGVSDETARNIRQVKFGEGMSGKAVAEQKPLVLEIQDYPSAKLDPHLLREGIQSSVSIPLMSAGQTMGAMNLSARRPHAFPPEELTLLTTIGRQLGIAVQNAQLYETLQRRTAESEDANHELEAFSYTISHDLRAPLRAIDGFSRILLEEYSSGLPAEAQRYLSLNHDSIQRMEHLIEGLLAFSRLSRKPLNKQRVDPAKLVREVLVDLRAEQEGRQVEFIVGDLPACQADPILLKQIFVNLLSNALKFTRKRETARIEIGCGTSKGSEPTQGSGETIYFVKDNGVGFDMQYADKLFGVFQRLHRTEEYEGTGVGLAIVQRIVHRHGGRVWAEAEVDKGAAFYFTLGGGTQ